MYRFIVLLFICFSCSLLAAPLALETPFEQGYPEHLVIQNRILLKVGGKPISIMDVVHKMDLLFYRQFPELSSSTLARYQFYVSSWRSMLAATIDDALIMMDAEEKKIAVNDGEVREELERLFGPDVVVNLDQLNLSLQEAYELLKTELIVQRMTGAFIRTKAQIEVHPSNVKKMYEKFLVENPGATDWVYRILSIRGEEHEKIAQDSYKLIQENNVPFEEVTHALAEEYRQQVSYSEQYRQAGTELSLLYRSILESMRVGEVSVPHSSEKVSRLFYLQKIEQQVPPPFKEVEEELKQQLLQKAITHHQTEYRQKLRERFGLTPAYLTQVVPEDLKPFMLMR